MGALHAESVPAPSADALRPVCALLEAVTRYAHGTRIYGSDHPLVLEAAEQALRTMHDAPASAWPIELTVGRDAFTHAEQLVHGGSDVGCLANALYESCIAVIRFERLPTRTELDELALWIGSLPQPRGGVLPACAEGAAGVFEVIPVSAGPLRFAPGVQEASEGAGADWRGLCRALAAQASNPEAVEAIEHLREQMGRSDAHQQALAAQVLGAVLAADAHPASRPARDEKAGAALALLSPELRSSMLSMCAAKGSGWLATHADDVPVGELVGALQAVDRPGHKPPTATVLLVHRLMGSTELSADARGALGAMGDKWDVPNASVAELMRDGALNDRCPQDYHAQLLHAATIFNTQNGAHGGAFEFEPVALRVCELALELLETKTADELTADHLHLLLERVAMLADEGRIDLMVAASDAASRLTASSIEAVARHAEQLAAASHAPTHVGSVVRRLGTCNESIISLAQLLVIAPEPVIATLASQLSELEIDTDHAHICAVAAAVSPHDLRAVVADAVQGAAPWINGLIDFLTACPDDVILIAIEPLLRTQDMDLRGRIVRVLDARLPEWPERLFEIALAHPDSEIRDIGRGRLEREPGHCRADVLTALLTGSLTGDMPDLSTTTAAIGALIHQGSEGVDRAAVVLKRLSHGCNRRRASICRELAAALEPFRAQPVVADALKRWKVSACGVVLELFVPHSHRKAA